MRLVFSLFFSSYMTINVQATTAEAPLPQKFKMTLIEKSEEPSVDKNFNKN